MIKNLIILFIVMFSCTTLFAQKFTNIAGSAGVDGGEDWQGVSFGDIDNDGDEDIFSVKHDGPPGVLYRNNGDGTFTEIAEAAGLSASANEGGVFGDYDNDGFLDLYVSDEGSNNFLFRNNGDTTFTDVSKASGANHSGLAISSPFGDYNNDGLIDIYIVNLSGKNILLRNNADNTFTDVTLEAGVGNTGSGITAVWIDIDLDGLLDLYVGNQDGNVMYQNNGDGTFTNITVSAGVGTDLSSEGVAAADFDNDGDMDLYVANSTEDILYQNNGDGTFTDISAIAGITNPGASLGVAFGDLDNDGWQDIFIANDESANTLYHNNGDGTFSDSSASAGIEDAAGKGQGAALADIDNDGNLDIFVANLNLQNRLYLNQGNSNNWFVVKLKGTASNRFGIGVRVMLKANNMWQTQVVDGGSGFSSQNSIPLEFGLGETTLVDSVIVYWSSGLVSTVTEQDANSIITIEEPLRVFDVQVNRALSPQTPIEIITGTSQVPQVHITNKGSASLESFEMRCVIDTNGVTVYSEHVTVTNLASQDTLTVSFPDWTPTTEGMFNLLFANLLESDTNTSNDTVYAQTEISFAKTPYVTRISPKDSSTDIRNTLQVIRARFSEPMDEDFFDSTTVIITGSESGPIPGRVLFSEANNVLNYSRDSDFTFTLAETVWVSLTTELRSLQGLRLDSNQNGVEEGSPTDDFTSFFIIEVPTALGDEENGIVSSFELYQNFPNPFNPITTIKFDIVDPGFVTLKVFNMLGQEVATLVESQLSTGKYGIRWNAADQASGVYYYQLDTGSFVKTRKLILLK
jgi:enediyne biosynthesis protein E4